jgi:hypothetical protein
MGLTEDSAGRIVTGETGLAHSRAERVSVVVCGPVYPPRPLALLVHAVSIEIVMGGVNDVGAERSRNRGRQGAILPIVNDQSGNLFCGTQLSQLRVQYGGIAADEVD